MAITSIVGGKTMRIVDDLDPETYIKNVKLRHLQPSRPDKFHVILEFRLTGDDAIEILVMLNHREEVNYEQVSIVFGDCLPENRIPKFAISTTCFRREEGLTPESVYLIAVAMVLMESEELSIVLSPKGDKLTAVLSIGAFETEGEIPLEAASYYLQPR